MVKYISNRCKISDSYYGIGVKVSIQPAMENMIIKIIVVAIQFISVEGNTQNKLSLHHIIEIFIGSLRKVYITLKTVKGRNG